MLCTLLAIGIAVYERRDWRTGIISFLAVVRRILPVFAAIEKRGALTVNERRITYVSWLLALGASISWGIYGLTIHQASGLAPERCTHPFGRLIVSRILTNVRPIDD